MTIGITEANMDLIYKVSSHYPNQLSLVGVFFYLTKIKNYVKSKELAEGHILI